MENVVRTVWGLVAVFLSTFLVIFLPYLRERLMPWSMFLGFGLLVLLSGWLLYQLQGTAIRGNLKFFLYLTGFSGLLAPVFLILHNFVYGIFVHFFGEGFWRATGGDEPVLFLLGLVVCPLGFLIGLIGVLISIRG